MSDTENERIAYLVNKYTSAMSDNAIEAYYGGSKFHNLGYWAENTTSQGMASRQLVEELLKLSPIKGKQIADIACGLGATTNYLAERFGRQNVTGVNISPYQIMQCKTNFPDLDFKVMNAVNLEFADDSLDAVVSVEAACHFNTRRAFFSESARVLKSGGKLVLCDIIFAQELMPKHHWMSPSENTEYTIEDYKSCVESAGFKNVIIKDIKQMSSDQYPDKVKRWALTQHLYGNITINELKTLMNMSKVVKKLPVSAYILLSAEKLDPAPFIS